ncbi:Putative transcriptional regulator, MerR-family [Corynebacterium glyciniphilum AJ 3170]|uniref:Putative transcriptional regulator, MerR-family n=1 Tax=Corynebacterium glyciniphilum AJ 3170 TaxID=1404245 RepID=X5EFE2_9CORY|nr:MerR family transcriptional regulator [Corynebacterium glyciniphilum]AHW65291.1 Putative transcriptional regulator, MerR-family [Corynebacterium glyciniphilum AJ 3170]
MNDPVLRSREVADIAGTTPRALRHYHSIGLLPDVPRDPNGYRRYSARDLVRVLRIRQLAASGMPLRRIREMLDQDVRSQDELLDDLDRDLAAQAARIEEQRRALAEVRQQSVRNVRTVSGGHPTTTEQFDQDVWMLVTATGDIDPDSAAAMLEVLQDGDVAAQVTAVATEFEELADRTHVDDAAADQLAGQMLRLGHSVLAAAGVDPAEDERPVAALIQEMQADALSPAQQLVWRRFMMKMGA